MPSELVQNWFGPAFDQLHPLMQKLHTHGGILKGDVTISYGKGLCGFIGRRLAKKLGVPPPGSHQLEVTIFHTKQALHWHRNFDNQGEVKSVFIPHGRKKHGGYWLEKTGSIEFLLDVDVINSGWHWRCIQAKAFGLSLPQFLLPRTTAYKQVEHNQYRFYVGFTLPLLGELLCYSGLLAINAD